MKMHQLMAAGGWTGRSTKFNRVPKQRRRSNGKVERPRLAD